MSVFKLKKTFFVFLKLFPTTEGNGNGIKQAKTNAKSSSGHHPKVNLKKKLNHLLLSH